jgi:hypothetical protein
MITASEVCEYECLVTRFVFGIVDILGLAAQSSFSLHRVSTSSQISCLFYFLHLRYFATHEHTLGNLEVIIYFHIGLPRLDLVRLLVYDGMRTYQRHQYCITSPLR